ncbi:hypothetical protein BC831DRAFT_55189 [Entophlyctis helioformis]|nr:hypothetical protein BC831DRAFT_55189 [Entophlyctis helioformis]
MNMFSTTAYCLLSVWQPALALAQPTARHMAMMPTMVMVLVVHHHGTPLPRHEPRQLIRDPRPRDLVRLARILGVADTVHQLLHRPVDQPMYAH